ncbi:S41 family peptidase [Undibacterium terreum]|uniref:Tail specific protease domain-containing protein n=1 Tax=Undibacterium terreum TaxID=1224302 RepID=A0A916UGY5_9BURK|nr:S41 family peptidase [Undibacterium terreum]GGC71766.1 hypothetical protein GCM10011396_18550 [Undibacterium terreum]
MTRRLLLATVLSVLSTLSHAQNDSLAEAVAAIKEKQYEKAADLYVAADRQFPGEPDHLYNAACAYALAGNKDKAFSNLRLSIEKGFTSVEHIEKDSDLISLHEDTRWPGVIARMTEKAKLDKLLWESPALVTPYKENISEDEKIAGLSKFWSEVKYNFVYVEKLKKIDWDKLYLEYLPKIRATRTTVEYYDLLMELCARLQDGHTNVTPPYAAIDHYYALPLIKTRLVENKVILTDVYDTNLRAQGVVPGLEITAVDGIPILLYHQRNIAPRISASTPQDMDTTLYYRAFLMGDLKEVPQLTFQDAGGKSFVRSVHRVSREQWKKTMPSSAPFEWKMLPGGVANITLNNFADQRVADDYMAAFDEIKKSTAMILDIRANGGGSSDIGYQILGTLTDKPFATSAWSTRDYKPSFRAWGRRMPDLAPSGSAWRADGKKLYTKPVIVLTSSAVYSAAEDFAVAFDVMQRGTIVGEATGGSTGQPLIIQLPGGGSARICTKRDTYPDGKAFVGVGIQPNIQAGPTIADLRAGKDTVLQTALDLLKTRQASKTASETSAR